MGQRTSESNFSDSIDEFFEPIIGDTLEEHFDSDSPVRKGKNRIAELRRRAEERLEAKRMQQELDSMDLDWDD